MLQYVVLTVLDAWHSWAKAATFQLHTPKCHIILKSYQDLKSTLNITTSHWWYLKITCSTLRYVERCCSWFLHFQDWWSTPQSGARTPDGAPVLATDANTADEVEAPRGGAQSAKMVRFGDSCMGLTWLYNVIYIYLIHIYINTYIFILFISFFIHFICFHGDVITFIPLTIGERIENSVGSTELRDILSANHQFAELSSNLRGLRPLLGNQLMGMIWN